MKRVVYLMTVLAVSCGLYAQKHYIDLHAGVGVGSWGYTLQGGSTQFGNTYSAGVGYTWFFHPCVGLQTGVQAVRLSSYGSLTEGVEYGPLRDYQGEQYMHRVALSGWREQQEGWLLEVPLGLRFRYFADEESRVGLHAAFGASLAVPVHAVYRVSGTAAHSAWYEWWQLELHDLPGRFGTEDVKQEESCKSRLATFNAMAYAELGMAFRAGRRTQIVLAAYAQYGITDFSKVKKEERTTLGFANKENGYTFMPEYHGLLGTDCVAAMRPWTAGLKIGLSVWPGKTDEQKKKQLKKLAEQYPELMPVREQYDTVYLRDTVYMRDTLVLHDTAVLSDIEQKMPMTREQAQLDELLSSAVIWFHFDEYKPILEPAYILDSVAAMMQRHPSLRIQVNGHACSIGTERYNKRLALRRAQAVAALLERKGVSRKRMKVASYGASQPYRYNPKHSYAKDRRVEIIPE